MSDVPIIPEQTTTTTIKTVDKPKQDESKIGPLTIRSLIALLLVLTVCILSISQSHQVPETLVGLASTVVAFYFGHEQGKSTK